MNQDQKQVTKRWIRNVSDEKAFANGCWFDPSKGAFVVHWIERYCRLYEGEYAGQPMMMGGCHECGTYGLPGSWEFDFEDQPHIALERARLFAECVAAGHRIDWQYEVTMRLFGWVKESSEWGRVIRRFRKAGIWIPKKSGKSPSVAAWGLYLLCGDGEQGQKIYSAAKDGKQAMISHTHAMEMVRMSPELSESCKINKSTGQITHIESRSFYKIIAGDNVNSQEGLNGSIMVDETHVVDRRLAGVLKGAGISRSEPLHAEVSTAGSNPDGYGKSQRDYGDSVAKGEIDDEKFLYQEYAAPQDITDEDLEKNIIAVGKMANPTWGRIIREEEFLHDYNTSKHSIDKLATFKMYRLNVWQRSSNPWLKGGDWDRCRKAYTEQDLDGEACIAGLDLSKTRDMSALVLVFPDAEEDEAIRILAHFWLPEKYAHENKHLAPFREWEKAGALTLTQGSVIDYGAIRAKFREWADKFRISKLVYDHRFAEETTQALSDGLYGAGGVLLEEGTGIERVAFLQTVDNYTPIIEEFERLVIAGKAHHNGNPVLTWQAGHVCKKTTGQTSKGSILVKPQNGDIKKIDGMVATLMALSMLHDISARSVYDHKGNFAL